MDDNTTITPGWHARAELKRATKSAHAAVDALPLMRRLMTPSVTLDDYRWALRGLHRVHLGLCPILARVLPPEAFGGLAPQDLLHFLQADLQELGAGEDDGSSSSGPSLRSRDEALGAWYVLEGSALGGAVIARHLRRCLKTPLPLAYFEQRLSPEAGLLSASGDAAAIPAPQARWARFERHLVARLEVPEAMASVELGARRAYEFVYAILRQAGFDAGVEARECSAGGAAQAHDLHQEFAGHHQV